MHIFTFAIHVLMMGMDMLSQTPPLEILDFVPSLSIMEKMSESNAKEVWASGVAYEPYGRRWMAPFP